ncbi:MAG TPA: hypothetical protein VMP13_08975 [Acidimicrobiia bacterium]|nr:hypothetical protein [Acidimicrobiia bacterium]
MPLGDRPLNQLIAPIIFLMLVATGCSADGESTTTTAATSRADIGTLTITGTECSFDVVEGQISSGVLSMTVSNESSVPGAADVFMILEGYSFDELVAHVEEEARRAEAGEAVLGHPSSVLARSASSGTGLLEAGESTAIEVDAEDPGDYAIVCIRHHEGANGPRPFAVVGPFEVVG